MTTGAGTLEQLALFAARALARLEEHLSAGNLAGLLNTLGLNIDPSAALPPAIVSAAQQVATAAAQLPALADDLADAIEANDIPSIVAKGVTTAAKVKVVLGAIDTLAAGMPAGLSAAGVNPAIASQFSADFGDRLFGFAVLRSLEVSSPAILGPLALVGIFEQKVEPKLGGGTYETRHLRLDRISMLLSKPKDALAEIYKWGAPDLDSIILLRLLARLLRAFGVVTGLDEDRSPPLLRTLAVSISSAGSPPGLRIRLGESIASGSELRRPVGERTDLTASATAALAAGVEVEVAPPASVRASGSAGLEGRLRAGIVHQAERGERFTLLGIAGAAGISAEEISIQAGADLAWNPSAGRAEGELAISGDIRGGQAFIDLSSSDGFIKSLLPAAKAECRFDLGFDWSPAQGLRFRGSSGLELKLPLHVELGPAKINGLAFGLRIENNAFPLDLGADIAARLGVLDLVVEGIGLTATLSFPPGGGDIGPVALGFKFKPPVGAGISVDTGALKGGGYLKLDDAAGEYIGALELSFSGIIDLKAVGIINTKLPDGDGFAFLILITAEFVPIQLGFGFTLLGVGGLLSLNRTLDVLALGAGVRNGALNSILFPKDVVANISRIASDIKTVFPLAKDHFVVAPMGRLGWGTPTMISLELGVIIDIPEPQIVIVGVMRIGIPAEDAPLLKLQVNFAGGIDFQEGIWFDAALFDSRLIGFTLEGQMALRIGWGEKPLLIISVGGFHPAFRDIPEDLKGMTRITMQLLAGSNPRITVQTYFAGGIL